ncbi:MULTISPECIES: ribosome maturation factor RimM [Aliivibrio]|uniref:Ribosome maturation factor RimM n=3 Tax=Aliivibrio TaxID=511678 RepID=RIMM_ALISL|nr:MULTISPECIES: ribosome maturation factor RimM [Aliivibrio]B6EGC0.1 RecName: Full=Ribosome maturation factor RimM [Aliivibrio salmonicida LFI1238]AZL84061.1 ribosome maturation factor RimM [Aliivibrio salmonicida]MBB1315386.1 ribosome maturation factor RimM [Aliivibrio sp. SR45-2]OCH22546.1 ribosome maturation factor RimM [Aliivibrio logei]OEF11546.1 ribosome maturation factor RimM [Aliivibrio logei 5S-186]CAQ78335.1 16S rRNA processing protein RimM [Aliivibrio salmonicida LFI1238]
MSKQDEVIVVGKFGASYGIRGWLKVVSFTDQPESIFDYKPLLIKVKDEWVEFSVESWKRHKGLVCKLEGLEVREEAQAYTNLEIAVKADALPELSEDEFYWRELFGMEVVTSQGYGLGIVDDIFETGSNDVLVVKANLKDAFGKKERLIPFIDEQVIKVIDREAQRIEVDWDPGF